MHKDLHETKNEQNIVSLKAKKAKKLIEQGLTHFSSGKIDVALEHFENSLALEVSPEALTYKAWIFSFLGRLDEAIALCLEAIQVDPDFGNPYNDVGTYYMKLGNLQAAIPWLERAKIAKKYEPKHFPYLNLGRIYLAQGMFLKALEEFEGALEFDPNNAELISVVNQIRTNHRRS